MPVATAAARKTHYPRNSRIRRIRWPSATKTTAIPSSWIENARCHAQRATEIAGLEKPTSCETWATPTDSATSNNDSK
jgi:hypothetical protein